MAIVMNPDPMTGREFRFIRSDLELSQERLASLIGRSAQAVARWEKGKSGVDSMAERLIRCL